MTFELHFGAGLLAVGCPLNLQHEQLMGRGSCWWELQYHDLASREIGALWARRPDGHKTRNPRQVDERALAIWSCNPLARCCALATPADSGFCTHGYWLRQQHWG